MAKKMRKSTKITLISVIAAIVVACATVLAVLLTKNDPNFLTASQREFFSALHAQNAYTSNLSENSIDLGTASYDSIVTIYDDYALVKDGSDYKLLSTKVGYEGTDTDLTFSGIVAVKEDIVVLKRTNLFYVYKINYNTSSSISDTLIVNGADKADIEGGLFYSFKSADKVLKVYDLASGTVLLEKEDVIDYSVSNAGVTVTTIELSMDQTTATANFVAYAFKNSELEVLKEYQTNAEVSQNETKYVVDGKYIKLNDFYVLRVSGNYLLSQRFEVSSSNVDCVINSVGYKLSQNVYSLVNGKSINLGNAMYFDTFKTNNGYACLVGSKISVAGEIDFADRIARYYDKNFELLISYDYDKFGDLIDYKQGLVIAKNGFIDVLGRNKTAINSKLAENNANTIILSSAEKIVFVKNANAVYMFNIETSKLTKLATSATTFVDGYMFAYTTEGANSEYFLIGKNGEVKNIANISTDEKLVAYSKLSTGYYFETVLGKTNLVKYDGSVLLENVAVDSIRFSLSSDRANVILTMENLASKKALVSKLPSGAILPEEIDDIVVYLANASSSEAAVSLPTNKTEDVAETELGQDYLSDAASNPLFIKTSGANIEVASYYRNLITKVTFNQYNRILDVVTDVETTTAIADLVTTEQSFAGLGVNKATLEKLVDRTYYNASVEYIERARNVVYNVRNANGTTTAVNGQIWYNDVHSNSTNYAIPESYKTGYTFEGYVYTYSGAQYKVSDRTTLALDNAITEVIMPTRSEGIDLEEVFVFEPTFTANTYKVAFNNNASVYDKLSVSGSAATIDAVYDQDVALPEEVFVSEGFRHIGWTTVQGGTTVEYQKGQTVRNLTSENGKVVTLYAVWAYNTYNIVFDSNLAVLGANATAYNENGSVYINRSLYNTITIEDDGFGTFPLLYAKSDNVGYARLTDFFVDEAGQTYFNIEIFFDYVEAGILYNSEKVATADNVGYKYNVYAFAQYDVVNATFTYDVGVNTTTLAGKNIGADYKAINLVSNGVYTKLAPIVSFKCGDSSQSVDNTLAFTKSGVVQNLAFGDNLEFMIGVNNAAAYIKDITLKYFVDTTEYVVKITGTYNKASGTVSYTISNTSAAVVTAEDGLAKVTLNDIYPKFNFTQKQCVLGFVVANIGFKEYDVSAKFNGTLKTVNFPSMSVDGVSYSYDDTIFYGRLLNANFTAASNHIFKNIKINGASYDVLFKYSAEFNDLYISGLTADAVKEGSGYYRIYNIDGLNVKLGFNGSVFYAEVYGQVTENIALEVTSQSNASTLEVVGTNKSGSANGITITGVDSQVNSNSNFKVNFAFVDGYRLSAVNIIYGGEIINGFRTLNYNNWNAETGLYGSYGYTSSEFIKSGKIVNTNVTVDVRNAYSITIDDVWFDLKVELVYERVSDIIINIDDSTKVQVLSGSTDITGLSGVTANYNAGVYKIRILGNEDVENLVLKTENGDVIYHIDSYTVPNSMTDITVTNKVEATWNSKTASYVTITVQKYAIEMTVTTYLGKGEGAYDKEEARDGGKYYTLDFITFGYTIDQVATSKTYGDLNPDSSVVTIVYNGKTFVMTMKDTEGDDYKGYLAAKYVLKDGDGNVVLEKSNVAGQDTMTFTLSDEQIGSFMQDFTLDIYYDAIEYNVVYLAGKFDSTQDGSNETRGAVETTRHVFNVDKSVSSDRFERDGWTNDGWTFNDSIVTRDGKPREVIARRNLSNENDATVTLYASWKVNTFTINYNNNVEAGSSDVEVDSEGTDIVKYLFNFNDLRVISRDGYVFDGWYVTANIDQKRISDQLLDYSLYTALKTAGNLTDGAAKEISVTAQWSKINYNLTADNFKFNDADENGSSTAAVVSGSTSFTVAFDTYFGTLPVLERIGYNFLGWSTSTSGTTMITSGTSILNSALFDKLTGANKDNKDATAAFDLYAIWEKQPFVVSFDMNYRDMLPGNSLADNGFSDTPSAITINFDDAFGTLPVVSAYGYEFKGWYFAYGYDYKAVTGTPCIESTQFTMAIWDQLYSTKGTYLSSSYENGDDATYKITLFAFWQIKPYTVIASSVNEEYVASADNKSTSDIANLAQGTASSKQMYYGDYAVIDFIPTEGKYINNITFVYGDSVLVYNVGWNSAERKVTVGSPSTAFVKTNFVESIEFIESDYSNGVNKIRIVLTFVKTNITVTATETTQLYSTRFVDGVDGAVLFSTLVEYSDAIDNRLFVYPYRVGKQFTGFELSNLNSETESSLTAIQSKETFFDTTITLKYTDSAEQRVEFYLWNGSAYVKNDTISSAYNLRDSAYENINYTVDTALVPVEDSNGVEVVMGESGASIKVVGFTYGGILINLPSSNQESWPADTYLAGYAIADSAPASGYFTENTTASSNVAVKYTKAYMVEGVVKLYAIYNAPVFEFKADGTIDSSQEFSVDGYETSQVKYLYVDASDIEELRNVYNTNKNLTAALQIVINNGVGASGTIKVAYLTAVENGREYIYRVADTYWNGTAAEDIVI